MVVTGLARRPGGDVLAHASAGARGLLLGQSPHALGAS